ncbi:hypothetical protein [uncultured Parabacteroides sp.]|uniref:hypothetical protein n=1 Tax=uncultured Parabacteroides sp. TaxID=512312 RepID=UPI002608DC4F|nr:hypothetical protein [uncultured Parabacteroides sp.]
MDGDNFAINRILEEAANLVGGSKESAGNAEQTEGYKRKQIERLKEYEIFDAVPNNVLHGIDGQLYFIDTQIRLR